MNAKPAAKSRTPKLNKSKLIIALIIITLLIGSCYFYKKYQNAVNNPQAQIEQKNSKETQDVVSKLSKILLLPHNEHPTVAKVEDVDKLKKSNENFYKNVDREDYLVLYPDLAIIYRKKENKIIDIAPIVDTSGAMPEGAKQTPHN